ncbi:MAG: TolC family protein [Planctomycetota bacterium]|nr:TolC family protein [Planctomycetota bacterium]
MKPQTVILFCAALLAAPGCPNQARDVASYRKVLDTGAPASAPSAPGPMLTLRGALAIANAHNERLAMSGETYLQALIDKDRAVAAFLPTVTLSMTHLRQETIPTLGGINMTPSPANDVVLSEGVNLFHGFRDVAALKRAAAGADERRALLREFQSSLLVETAGVYYQVLRSEALVAVLRNSLGVQEERVTDLSNKLAAGTVRAVDVSQARSQAAATGVLLRQAQADVVRGRATLAFLLGAQAVESTLADGLAIPAVPARTVLESPAQQDRPDILATASATEAARRSVEDAIGQYYPSVRLDLTQFLHRESFPPQSRWMSLLEVNVPVFSAGLIEADVRTAWSRLRQAGLNESLVRRQVLEEVRLSHENLSAALGTLERLRTQEQAARDGLRQASEAAKAGVGTDLERLISQDQYLSAQVQVITQTYTAKIAYLQLLRATGHLRFSEGPLKVAGTGWRK